MFGGRFTLTCVSVRERRQDKWYINLGFTLWLVAFYRSLVAHTKDRSNGKQRTGFPVCRYPLLEKVSGTPSYYGGTSSGSMLKLKKEFRRSYELFSDLTSLLNSIRILNQNPSLSLC